MNDVSREKRWQDRFPRLLPRYALLACLALVVASLGVALTPVPPPLPAEPSLSEQARAAALTETVRLRDAGSHLGTGEPGTSRTPSASPTSGAAPAGNPAVERTVTLLTTQAQALLAPGQSASDAPVPTTPAATAATGPPPTAGTPAALLPATVAELVTALAGSGRQRLADAAVADGGMARLLAAVGTAQLLQASALAAETGTAAPPPADIASPEPSGTCQSESDASQAAGLPGVPATKPAGASAEAALAAVVRTEAETIYAYQVALPRVSGEAAKSAAEALAHHDALLSGAESLSRRLCFAVPPREAGYAVGRSFLAAPAAGLGKLEAGALPVYGDLIALSEGETRQFAIAALYDSGKRSVLWGADPGALPGLADASLPSPAPLPSN